MRPVNLIPLEERHGENRPMRTGPVPYLLVGTLIAVLAGVTALVLTGNQIADRKSELAKVEREDAVASARAKRLSAYTQFRTLREQRVQTVTSLADSRFDWERVMRELSLVLPHDVWLTSLDASAAGGGEGGGSGGLSGSITGPSLSISGCATGHDAVAGFVTALKEIDGVTRVGVESSELSSQKEGAGKSGGSGGSGGSSGGGGESSDCRTRSFIPQFKMVVAFDAAPVPQIASSGEAPAAPSEQAQTASSETSKSGEASAGGESSKAPEGGG